MQLQGKPNLVEVRTAYAKRMQDELDLKVGDVIKILKDDELYHDGWYFGQNLKSMKHGLFPVVFTVPVLGKEPIETKKKDVLLDNDISIITTIDDIDKALEELKTDGFSTMLPQSMASSPIEELSNLEPSGGSISSAVTSLTISTNANKSHRQLSFNSKEPSKAISPEGVLQWTPEEVTEYFLSLKYEPSLANHFRDDKISGKILLELDLNHLKELNINPFGTRFEIFKEIEYLRKVLSMKKDNNSSINNSPKKTTELLPPALTNKEILPNSHSKKLSQSLVDLPSANNSPYIRQTNNNSNSGKRRQRPNSLVIDRTNLPQDKIMSGTSIPVVLADGIFESPGKAPKPPSYPSPIQVKTSPVINKYKHRSPEDTYQFPNERTNSTSSAVTTSSKYQFPNTNSPLTYQSKKNVATQTTLSSSSTTNLSSNTEDTTISDPIDHNKVSAPSSLRNPSNNNKAITTGANGNRRNSSFYPQHQKNISAGSFVDLFNRVSMLSPSKAKTDPEISHFEQPRRPKSAMFINRSSPKHTRSSSVATGYVFPNSPRKASNARSSSIVTDKNTNVINLNEPHHHSHHSRRSSQQIAHARSSSSNVATVTRHRKTPSLQNSPRETDGATPKAQHKRSSSFLAFFSSSKPSQDSTTQKPEPESKSKSRTPLHSRKSSLVTSPTKHSKSSSSKKKIIRSISDMDPLPPPPSNSHSSKSKQQQKSKQNRSISEQQHARSSSSSKSTTKLPRPNNNNNKQSTSAFQEGIRTISVKDAILSSNCSGWMNKKGTGKIPTWKTRFFTLHGTRLSYFLGTNDTRERGLIDITSHHVVPIQDDGDDKLTALYAAGMRKGRYCFKLVPPQPGSKKGLTFTQPRVHYFAVETRDEMRSWLAALIKATIDLDTSVPVISSFATATVSLGRAKEMLKEARELELLREQEGFLNEEDEDQLLWEQQILKNEDDAFIGGAEGNNRDSVQIRQDFYNADLKYQGEKI